MPRMTLENHRERDQGRLFSSLLLTDSGSFFLFLACALMISFLPGRSPAFSLLFPFPHPPGERIFSPSCAKASWPAPIASRASPATPISGSESRPLWPLRRGSPFFVPVWLKRRMMTSPAQPAFSCSSSKSPGSKIPVIKVNGHYPAQIQSEWLALIQSTFRTQAN